MEKATGDVRILHDISYPENCILNVFTERESCKYESFDDILTTLWPGTYLAKCDLQLAYCSIPICT